MPSTPKLYLAEIGLRHYKYPKGHRDESTLRLVWAPDPDTADTLIRQTYTKEDPYGSSTEVTNVDLNEALGPPPPLKINIQARTTRKPR